MSADNQNIGAKAEEKKLGRERLVLVILTVFLCSLFALAVAINAPGDDQTVKFLMGAACGVAVVLALFSFSSLKAVKFLRWFYIGIFVLYVVLGAIAERLTQ